MNSVTQRPSRAVQNPHDPDAHYADKKTKQWTGYKVHVTETVDPEEPIKKKGEPAEHFITEMFTTEAAQDEMAGLTEVLKREQQHHEITPQAMYSDARLCDRAHLNAGGTKRHRVIRADASRSAQGAVQYRCVSS